jgi:Abnormal spindle-like microcephaly-assoc'd, ASPM-SPD-2-Hydin/Transmembrane protein 131-like N-terminal
MINQRFATLQASPAENSRPQRTSSKRQNPFIFVTLAAALLVCLTQVGCTGLTSANATAPADPTNTTTVAVAGATGTFGSVATGTSASQTFTVTNTGSATLTITQLAASGTGFSVSGFTLPITVNAGQGTSFIAKFAPTAAGAVTGSISMTANTNPAVSTITLSGTGTASSQPTISVSPTTFNFTSVSVGTTSTHAVTITNSGTGTLNISSITAVGPGFSMSGFASPVSLSANQSTTINAIFSPGTIGQVSGIITIANNSTTPSVAVNLLGVGIAESQAQPSISVNPTSFNFSNVTVGSSSTQTITISNSSSTTLSISNIAASGSGFSVSGFSLPVSVPANQSTTVTAKFLPTTTGAVSGGITFTNNSASPSVVVALNGTGVAAGQPAISVNPTSVSFGSVTVGAPNSQPIVIQNNGTASLTISQATVSGTGFSISGITTPATIAMGGSATFNVAFSPTSGGAASGSVSLVSNAAGSPLGIPLSGTGVAATFLLGASASSLTFPSVAVGSNSSQTVTLTNNGNSTVTIGTVSATGTGFSASGVAAGQTIGSGQTATLSVAFAPTSAATVSGTVKVTSNATNSPISISLSGTGTQVVAHSVSLSWTASTSTVVGYNVYRSTVSGGPYTLITSAPVAATSYSDTAVQAGVTYFYVVTAVDANGNESAFSNEASVTVPTP